MTATPVPSIFVFALCFLAFGFLFAVVVLAGVWCGTRREQALAELKRSMIERGMSVDEIERVIAAGNGKAQWCRPAEGAATKVPAWSSRDSLD